MHKKITTLLLASAFITLGSSIPVSAGTHWTGDGAVDGKEIRWGTARGKTAYTTARNHSITVWDNMGSINIAGDNADVVEDLSFRDIYVATSLLGRYTPMSGADVIEYNTYNFTDMTSGEQKKTALHEMGHALGFNHHDSGIMKQGLFSMTTLDSHIKSDYYSHY
ncbi:MULTISPECIES: hypothetical protein [Exiguobacterium]|uniref:hypothetical protein n=1 Tax=Exiguobacterium TaxID=33986 RepID=UPI00068192F7|nr:MULTISPECIES: hypothetical protein [Exiguobacterium]KNH32482.1 hypothetical protein ACS74_14400 [Exiguobacterium acetylicum]